MLEIFLNTFKHFLICRVIVILSSDQCRGNGINTLPENHRNVEELIGRDEFTN